MSQNLRTQILHGGTYLVLRRASAIFLNLLNIFVLTKFLGIGGYGLYASAIIIYGYISNLTQLGVSVHLIRQEKVAPDDFHQTFTVCSLLSVIGIVVSLAALPWITNLASIEGLFPVLFVMIAALPVTLMAATPAAMLERGLDYKQLTVADLYGQILFSVLGLSLVALGAGIWGVVIGWWAQQVLVAILLFRRAGYRPKLRWNFAKVKQMLGYGFSFSLSLWIWQAKDLVNPLLVGHFAGAEGVGIVALTIRLAQALSFIKDATWRLSIAAFAQIQTDLGKLLTAVREGMFLQIVALGPILIFFNWVGVWILPRFFSTESAQILNLFPFIALGFLVNGAFNMHSAALYVLGENHAVAKFHLVYIILFVGATVLLAPQIGVLGYALAELAAMPAYVVIYLAVRRRVGWFSHAQALLILGVFTLAMLTHYLGWLAGAGLLILPFVKSVREDAVKILKVILSQLKFKHYLKFVVELAQRKRAANSQG